MSTTTLSTNQRPDTTFHLREALQELTEPLGRKPEADELIPLLTIYIDELAWFVTVAQAAEAQRNTAAIWNGEPLAYNELRKRRRQRR